MGIVSGFYNQTIDNIYSVALDGWGDVATTLVYSSVDCRWQEGVGRIVGETEDAREYKIEAWINPTYTILQDYEVLKGSTTYRVIKVITSYNIFGVKDHLKLYLV